METLTQQLVNQLYNIIKTKQLVNKQSIFEVEIRLGNISIYNQSDKQSTQQDKNTVIPMIQPLFYQLPNKKMVKHHQFLAYIDQKQFETIVNYLKLQDSKYKEYIQEDYILPDSAKMTVLVENNQRQTMQQIKKTPIIQDIDILMNKPVDMRISCKILNNPELISNIQQNTTVRIKNVIKFCLKYISHYQEIHVYCSTVQNTNTNQQTYEIEIKTNICSQISDSMLKTQLNELISSFSEIIQS